MFPSRRMATHIITMFLREPKMFTHMFPSRSMATYIITMFLREPKMFTHMFPSQSMASHMLFCERKMFTKVFPSQNMAWHTTCIFLWIKRVHHIFPSLRMASWLIYFVNTNSSLLPLISFCVKACSILPSQSMFPISFILYEVWPRVDSAVASGSLCSVHHYIFLDCEWRSAMLTSFEAKKLWTNTICIMTRTSCLPYSSWLRMESRCHNFFHFDYMSFEVKKALNEYYCYYYTYIVFTIFFRDCIGGSRTYAGELFSGAF